MALSSSWAPPTALQREHENTPEPMAPEDLQAPWVESSYPTHDRDMTTHMLPQEWASPNTVSIPTSNAYIIRMGKQAVNGIAGIWTFLRDNCTPEPGSIDTN